MSNGRVVLPGNPPLTPGQQQKLEQIATWLSPGRDVVLAIDLTASVGFGAAGQLKLSQIILDSLQPGDLVYLITFGSQVNQPVSPFLIKDDNTLQEVLTQTPFQADPSQRNTDIQNAELYVYRYLAQINQDRLYQKQPVRSQSVVWITDAPLNTPPGITSEQWIETPADSLFRQAGSKPSIERQVWQSQLIRTEEVVDLPSHKITIMDFPPQVQESCTPRPGGGTLCLVDDYVHSQLFWPQVALGTGIMMVMALLVGGLVRWRQYQSIWTFRVVFESDLDRDPLTFSLKSGQRLALGGLDPACVGEIDGIPGVNQVGGYLERRGLQLYLVPLDPGEVIVDLNGVTLNSAQPLKNSQRFRLNCHKSQNSDYILSINRK